MFLLFILVAFGVLVGAAAHTTLPVFLVAAAVITGWLFVFHIRERIARAAHR